MRTALDVFLLVLGFCLLIKSAEFFVNACVEIARRLRIPSMIIGLTVVAMGTSAPELVISVSAAIGGSSDLAVANIVGSNLFNLLFIVGFCALLYPISIRLKTISKDYWFSVLATLLLLVMVAVFGDSIPRYGVFALLAIFVVYMTVVVRDTLKSKTGEDGGAPPKPLARSILFAVLGAALIVAGGELTVSSAVNIAVTLGVTERVIGLTIVAIGTSLPELATAIIACRKKEGEFAIGLIVGSSIFNILFVLGLTGAITPLTIDPGVLVDVAVLSVGTLAFFVIAHSSNKVVRLEGLFMMLMYGAYLSWVLLA